MQIDLQPPMRIEGVTQDGKPLVVTREGSAWFVQLQKHQRVGSHGAVRVDFSGVPKIAANPPWDGGLTWAKDDNGQDWVATTCQMDGTSVWWPCKDHPYDEPDSMAIAITAPEHLVSVANGRLRNEQVNGDGTKTYTWFVSNPINNYGVNMNIGDYVHFGEVYQSEAGALDCDYFVLRDNLKKARTHFGQVPGMMDAFEHWFGPYPFYEDGFKLVEVPYPGMEHQSSVTYGNGYRNGYGGRDVSGTGWGYNFDFMIIHETGHEWFANSITNRDIADMWVHEGFTAYSEGLYLDFHYGKDAATEYVIGTRRNIRNDRPIIGTYGVNARGSGDMYSKGANVLHMIRTLIDDDAQWRTILRGLNKEFYHQTVSSQQIEAYINAHTDVDLTAFFDQYLRTTMIPELEIERSGSKLRYRWTNCVDGFDMPVRVRIGKEWLWLEPVMGWTEAGVVGEGDVVLDVNFYAKMTGYRN
ncbi:MAG: M1 family metallopeptidase, partial [Saprospiraceae bacterium]|nr:M1 family metallopeptidase [Saprospiraceae bacterium]